MKIWPPPVMKLFRITKHHGADPSKFWNVASLFGKFLLLEPFRLIEQLATHRKVNEYRIESVPVFILGFYRSGTTYLQRLLLHDNRFGYQTVVDTAYPEGMFGVRNLLMPLLNIWKMYAKPFNKFQKIPLQWHQPGEEDLALLAFGCKESATWAFLFPSSFESIFSRYTTFYSKDAFEHTWKQSYLYWLKKLSVKNSGKRLLLKNPPNMARVPQLLEMFPDAKFIFIHRNPYHVFGSCKYLWKMTEGSYSFQEMNSERIVETILYSYRLLTKQYLKYRKLIPKAHLYELSFEKLVHDPLISLEKLYDGLDLGDFNSVKSKISGSLPSFSTYTQVDYNLSSEEKMLINESWGPIMNRIFDRDCC